MDCLRGMADSVIPSLKFKAKEDTSRNRKGLEMLLKKRFRELVGSQE